MGPSIPGLSFSKYVWRGGWGAGKNLEAASWACSRPHEPLALVWVPPPRQLAFPAPECACTCVCLHGAGVPGGKRHPFPTALLTFPQTPEPHVLPGFNVHVVMDIFLLEPPALEMWLTGPGSVRMAGLDSWPWSCPSTAGPGNWGSLRHTQHGTVPSPNKCWVLGVFSSSWAVSDSVPELGCKSGGSWGPGSGPPCTFSFSTTRRQSCDSTTCVSR